MSLVFEGTTPRAQAEIIEALSELGTRSSRAGEMREQLAVLVKSPDPRERYLFREKFNLAFQLQEHWAYWEGANPGHVERYNSNMETWIDPETGKMPGSAYGDRMRNTAGHDQVERVIEQLRESPETRRAQIVVSQPHVEDYSSNDVSCTSYLHPLLRDGRLHMVATIRSQDMYWGYPYDTANNQWIQEVLAGILDAELGEYWHLMDSCHYYTDFEEQVFAVATEGAPISGPPALLNSAKFEVVWDELCTGLELARRGAVPYENMDAIAEPFYRDWLGLMTAYEQNRFHGSPGMAEEVAREYISNGAWLSWMLDRIEVPA